MRIVKSRKSTVSVMANGGEWSAVKIIQPGEKRLCILEQSQMTIAEAMELWITQGIPVTVL